MVGMPGFWPGFLALDRRTGGGAEVVGGWGGRGWGKYRFTPLFLAIKLPLLA